MAKVGVIGGSGLYEMAGLEHLESLSLMTPFGEPSCNFITGSLEGTEVVFLPRHGKGHRISPSFINYRANIFAFKKLGVNAILSVSACGSLKEDIKPLDFVLPDQFLDLTKKRESSFFTEGIVAHVGFAEPTAPELRKILETSARELGLPVHAGGTYVNMEGPQFSTRAESSLYRRWGMDIIGMTNATEAKLARELEISYATLAAVTDYDCWHPDHASVTVDLVIENLLKNVDNAKKILQAAIPQVGRLTAFSAADALKHSIVTAPEHMSEEMKKALKVLIGKYVE